MNDADLARAAESHDVFAKLTPAHKERIVRAPQARTATRSGFMGDGINDAPALRDADVGISVDTGGRHRQGSGRHHPAGEEPDGAGRRACSRAAQTFGNMIKYIKMTASSNFGNVFCVLVASAFLPFLPMLPIHLLVQNLLYDFSQIAIPFDDVDEELLQQPRKWDPATSAASWCSSGPSARSSTSPRSA